MDEHQVDDQAILQMMSKTSNRSRFSCLVALLGGICACSANVELERPMLGTAGANAGSAGSGTAGGFTGGPGDGGPELILGAEHVEELLSDGTRLFWINDHLQMRGCVALNCAQSVITYGAVGVGTTKSASNRIRNFDFTEQRVVWRATAGISSCLKSGCDSQEALLASDSQLTWWGLSASDADVYWSSDLDIYRCADTGCSSVPSALASGETTSMKLVFQGKYAYWIGDDGIRRAPRDASEPPTTIVASGTKSENVPGVGEIDELGVDADHLYWLGASGHISSCPIAGCSPEDATLLVPTAGDKQAFQVDASGLYWLDIDAGRAVVHCPLSGCTAPTPLTSGEVYDFALDETSLYWTDTFLHSGGTYPSVGFGFKIRRIAKPAP